MDIAADRPSDGRRHCMSLIPAVTAHGDMRFMIIDKGSVNAGIFLAPRGADENLESRLLRIGHPAWPLADASLIAVSLGGEGAKTHT
ncbi:MAG: hypothetical protein ACRECU_03120 [Methylocella sp.]